MGRYIPLEDIVKRHHPVRRVLGRIFICIGLLILAFLILAFGAITVVCKGPSPSARDLFVTTVMETSAAKFLAQMYFSDETIATILANNTALAVDEITDQDMIVIPAIAQQTEPGAKEQEPIEVFDVVGSTYNGKMMVVHDPSRLCVAAPPDFSEEAKGIKLDDLVKNAGGVAGINAGGFKDENGVGNGGQPSGYVIKDGVALAGGGIATIIGFDKDNKLIVGNMTGAQAIEKGMRDAVSFGPVFIVNGKRSEVAGTGGGLNPRTCIGQTKDGAVLLLTIDGRQAGSLGATYGDCIDIMESYGAINAANLDGGSSTSMFYNGEIINVSASVYGPRNLPSAFIVLP